MEKEAFWWHSAGSKPPPEFASGSVANQLPPHCFFNLNWKQQQPMTHDGDLQSALSSLDGAVIGELIGRLGTICNPREISPDSQHRSADTSCYSTPLNSPPKLNLSAMDHRQHGGVGLPMAENPMPGVHFMPFSADPWFAEAAARFSRSGGMNPSGFRGQFGLPETPGKLSRVSSSKSMKVCTGSRMGAPENGNEAGSILGVAQLQMEIRSRFGGSSTPEGSELGNRQEESSVSDRITAEASSLRGVRDNYARKRKAAAKGKEKEAPLSYSATKLPNVSAENSAAKRCRPAEPENGAEKAKTEHSGDTGRNQGNDAGTKLPEPPKDYIHVRARRGQATDSHSLAERVRREKISKRMKFLQDLVPGCNKVTGKAVMLDEIINYVQSLQRQVEFLSMKLATLNPQLDHMEDLIPKEMYQVHGLRPQPAYTGSTRLSCPQATPLQSIVSSGLEVQFSQNAQLAQLDAFADATSQLGEFWEEDLQSVARIGFAQNHSHVLPLQSFRGQMQANHMKVEL